VATLNDTWEPANQLEHQLRDALREGDQDAYFAQVSAAELFVPLAPEEAEAVLADPSAFTWPTATHEGRTHVLAYTSAEAGRACLGPSYQHFFRMTLAGMARQWPDQEWWLALNSGLPIEGYLPAWFIGQLTAGIAPIPGETSPQDASTPPPLHEPPLHEPPVHARGAESAEVTAREPDLAPHPPGHEAAPPENGTHPGEPVPYAHETRLDGIPPVPPHDPAEPGVAFDGPPPVPAPEPVPEPVPELVPPVPEPVREPMPEPLTTAQGQPQDIPPPMGAPPPDSPFDVDASPIALHITPDATFTPLDEEERHLFEAASRGDRKEFLRTLLGVRQIWVPVVEGGDLMLAPGRPGFQWYVDDSSGRPVVPLYTGPGRMKDAMGGHPFVLSDLAKVLRFWPDPALELVVNGGTPIGASIAGDRVTAMAAQVDADAAARLATDFPAQSDAERQMFDVRHDPDMVVKVLMDTTVFLPVWSRTPPAVQTRPGDALFPWSAVPVRGRPSVLAFTSFDWMKAAVGTTGFVMPTFAELIAGWPGHDWSVSVNPGTPIELMLSGEQIRALAAVAAGRVAEDMPPPRVPEDGPPQPVTEPVVAPGQSGEPPVEAGVPSAREPRETAGAAADPPPGPWAIMQKVVPHDQVGWYLEQAYDRVAGFVHRVQDVVDLNTPKLLFEALGLLRDGSPFTVDDGTVHVIRWPAYRSGLYRVPFGGQSDEALRAWGDSGWVLEPPPFGGDGFAPGSAGSIREYKVDSMRLPHGSEMYAIGSDGSERFVARYDADRQSWGDSQ
jgi:SseB protein N-terminal domain